MPHKGHSTEQQFSYERPQSEWGSSLTYVGTTNTRLPLSLIFPTQSIMFNCSIFTTCKGLVRRMTENAYYQRMGFSAQKVEHQHTELRVTSSAHAELHFFSYRPPSHPPPPPPPKKKKKSSAFRLD